MRSAPIPPGDLNGPVYGDPDAGGTGDRLRWGVKALVAGERGVLLVKERRADGSTFWSLPGGGVQARETPRSALHREIDEELGCRVAVEGCVCRCVYRHRSAPDTVTVYAVFEGALTGEPKPNPATGVIDSAWATGNELPDTLLPPFRALLRRGAPLAGSNGADDPRSLASRGGPS